MDTIKTAVVVALLLAILYGVYVTLNKESVGPPLDVAGLSEGDDFLAPPDIDAGFDTFDGDLASSSPSSVARTPRTVDAGDDEVIRNPRTSLASSPADDMEEASSADRDESAYLKPPRKPPVDTLQASTYSATQGAYGSNSADAGRSRGGEADWDEQEDQDEDSDPPRDRADVGLASNDRYGGDRTDDADDDADNDADNDKARRDEAGGSYESPGSDRYAAAPNSRYGGPSSYYSTPQDREDDGDQVSGDSTEPRDSSTEESSPRGSASIAPTRFSSVKRDAETHLKAGRYRSALATLSAAYGDPVLTDEENDTLLRMLDPLAGKVIYSREHLLEPSYTVRRSDTLMDIAEQYKVPWQLLANINGVENPRVMMQGTELKVVRGPFRAEISLDGNELTLFLNQLYAGRFPVTFGREPAPEIGDFTVEFKEEGRTYYADDGREVSTSSSENPYGGIWIDLGASNLGIHGSAQQETYADAGCIGLSPRDARDIFGILSVGSRVTIIR
jgi:LysM repeat protein